MHTNRLQKTFLIVTIILIASKAFFSFGIFFYPLITADNNLKTTSSQLINLTNRYRINRGLKPLIPNARLTQAALNHGNDILAKGYFDHTSPDGRRFSDWIKDVNYKYFYVGENLAIDFEDDNQAFRAWVDSPEHLANLEKPQYQEIGIATVRGKMKGRDTIVMVQLFGSRVLGVSGDGSYTPTNNVVQNYFYPESTMDKYMEPVVLQKLNMINDFLLIIFVALTLITYKPRKSKNQPRIKSPITNLYQAKIFNE